MAKLLVTVLCPATARRYVPGARRRHVSMLMRSAPATAAETSVLQRTEVRLVAPAELVPRIGMRLPSEMLEGVGGGDATQLAADIQRGLHLEPLQQAAAERVADARRIHDAVRHDGGDGDFPMRVAHRAAVLAA